jgi:hypothetical protein
MKIFGLGSGDWEPNKRKLPVETVPLLRTIERECGSDAACDACGA